MLYLFGHPLQPIYIELTFTTEWTIKLFNAKIGWISTQKFNPLTHPLSVKLKKTANRTMMDRIEKPVTQSN